MNGLAWCASNSTDWKAFRSFFGGAVVACRYAFLDNLNLTIESRRATFHQRYIRSQTHLINMPSCVEVVQSVKDHGKPFEPFDIELRIFDIRMMSHQLHIRIEPLRRFFSYLYFSISAAICPSFVRNPLKLSIS